jgi:hypothetical protein
VLKHGTSVRPRKACRWWQWQECSLLSPAKGSGTAAQPGALSEANGTREDACAAAAHKSTKGKASAQCCIGEPGRKTKGRISPQVHLRFALGFCEEIQASGQKWELPYPLVVALFSYLTEERTLPKHKTEELKQNGMALLVFIGFNTEF